MTLGIIFSIIRILSVFILIKTFTAMNNKSSVFDYFFQQEFWSYFNSINFTVILAAIIIYSSLYLIKNRIKTNIFKFSAEEIKNIFAIYGMFYTSKIELAGRKGSRIFSLFLIIFVYLAILNFMELLFVAVTAKSQLSTNFWFSLTIIILVILLGIRNKGLKFFLMFWNTGVGMAMRIKKNLLEKCSLVAFGVLEKLITVLQLFKPATLGQIWANEKLQVLFGFFKIKNWCSGNGITAVKQVIFGTKNSVVLLSFMDYGITSLVLFLFTMILVNKNLSAFYKTACKNLVTILSNTLHNLKIIIAVKIFKQVSAMTKICRYKKYFIKYFL